MATDKIRIKDIAARAGVSVGTVDRVLHKRPNVSPAALEKVERALKEMDYMPNMYASALAYNKSYTFYCIIPKHESEAYWEEVEEGAVAACERRRDFSINLKMMYYNRFSAETFVRKTNECLNQNPDGVVVVPSKLDVTRRFTDELHNREIPFLLLDSYMPDLKPLSFYGQDSFSSGYFAARMLMLIALGEREIMLMKQMRDGNVASKQQENREMGFRHYMYDHFPDVKITEVNLPLDEEPACYDRILEDFFTSHPHVHHCITFNSKAHLVGEFLQHSNRRNIQIMGYDMVEKNAECVRQGSISFLIAQHGYMQGYACIETLFDAIVLKKEVNPVNYMPIELLTKENVEFYRRTNIG
ncbi:MAG: LacI family DNA-binding transcriptional regulator [Prevotella sp.]|nr:LacI family DNA-binding transcriptional regulator [Prevotella sp.]